MKKYALYGLLYAISMQGFAETSAVMTSKANTATKFTPPAVEKPNEAGPLTGTFAITSNYIFRGVSNSNNNPAVQGGLTYSLPAGFYANIWGSNVDFLDPEGVKATVEFDAIFGIANDIGDFHYDINIDRYNYPRASGANYYELIAALTYRIFTATIGYSSNVYGYHKDGTYYSGALNLPLDPKYAFHWQDVSVMGSVGHYKLPESVGLLSYTDYMLGIEKVIDKYTLLLQWVSTNGEAHLGKLDDSRLVGTVQVDF